MLFTVLSCPQCAAPLPRQAAWRMVACPYCGAMVTRSKTVVEATRFREAKARVYGRCLAACDSAARVVHWNGQRFRIMAQLGRGQSAEVYLAERINPMPQRVTLKLAHDACRPGALAAEAGILKKLCESHADGAACLGQRLPQLVGSGTTEAAGGHGREMVLLRHPCGYWGSLADVMSYASTGVDPRHGVWIWRRILDVLALVHDSGWSHGDLLPEHLLVHPRDHGVHIVGWARAQPLADATAIARDLMQTAWTVRALLCGGDDLPRFWNPIPAALANLLRRSSEDADWCAQLGARGLDQALIAAAGEAFGAARFIPFNPTTAHCL